MDNRLEIQRSPVASCLFVQNNDVLFSQGAQSKFAKGRVANLSDDQHLQGQAEAVGDSGGHDHAAARQAQNQIGLYTPILEPATELASGIIS